MTANDTDTPASPASTAPAASTSVWHQPLVRLLLLIALLVIAWLVARALGVQEWLQLDRLATVVREARTVSWAAPAFVVAYVLFASLGLPATPLTLAGGAIFGPWIGTALNWLGATLGATGAYFIARTVGGDAVKRLLGARGAALDKLAGDGAFTTLLRLRLLPVVPFNALNFGAGLTGVRPGPYIASTALGIVPGTAVYTWFADALLAGVDGARQEAFLRIAMASVLLIALSFAPRLFAASRS